MYIKTKSNLQRPIAKNMNFYRFLQFLLVIISCINSTLAFWLDKCGRISGNRNDDQPHLPWLVRIDVDSLFRCSGVAIYAQWVLTSSSCLHTHDGSFVNPQGLQLWLNADSIDVSISIGAQNIFPHPGFVRWNKSSSFNIALIKLEMPFEKHPDYARVAQLWNSVCLPASSDRAPIPPIGTQCHLASFGTRDNSPHWMPLNNWTESCFSEYGFTNPMQVCATFEAVNQENENICEDSNSGGLIQCLDNKFGEQWVAQGILSRGACDSKKYSLVETFSLLIDWIDETVHLN